MDQTRTPVSRAKVLLLWLVMIGNLVFWIWFWAFRGRSEAPPAAELEPADMVGRAVLFLIVSVFFLGSGVLTWFILLFTNCFTFNFNKPFLRGFKGKLYLAKIVVPLLLALGLGGFLSVPVSPLLEGLGMDPQLAWMLPVLAMVVILQILQVWVGIWAPIEKRIITHRLMARGITLEQLRGAAYVGISDAARSSLKKLTIVEDDMGALWITSQQLIYWGDSQDLVVTPGQLVQIERRADAGSASMLGGLAHVILHLHTATGELRQVRLHVEAEWTLGATRRRMEQLADMIAGWHSAAATPGAVAAPTA